MSAWTATRNIPASNKKLGRFFPERWSDHMQTVRNPLDRGSAGQEKNSARPTGLRNVRPSFRPKRTLWRRESWVSIYFSKTHQSLVTSVTLVLFLRTDNYSKIPITFTGSLLEGPSHFLIRRRENSSRWIMILGFCPTDIERSEVPSFQSLMHTLWVNSQTFGRCASVHKPSENTMKAHTRLPPDRQYCVKSDRFVA